MLSTVLRCGPMATLAGQRIVVIGGSAGIGLETARNGTRRRRRGHPHGRDRRAPRRRREGGRRPGAVAFDAGDSAALAAVLRATCPTPIDHVMVTAGAPHYIPPLEIEPEEARQAFADKLALTLQVAQEAVGKVRPGGSLLFMGGTGGRRPRRGFALTRNGHRRAARSDREPRARARAGPRQPDRGRLRRHAIVGARCSATTSTSGVTSCAPRCRSAASSDRPTSPRSPCTS